MKLAFLGVGVMGGPMAGHLAEAGHEVTVFNRSRGKAEAWAARYGGQIAGSPAEAAKDAAFVLACVGNDADLREVTIGETGAFAAMRPGSIFVDHTTASAEVARDLAAYALRGNLQFLDAPVSGGQAGAEAGRLSIMVGGEADIFARAEPLLRIYGQTVKLIGPSGSGQLAKMANQICIAGIVQGLAEALAFATRAGIDGEKLLSVIGKGAAQSWQMDNRARTMLEGRFDFGFAVDWMIKDLQIVLDEASRNGANLPETERVLDYYREVSHNGGGRLDTSSLIKRL